MFTGIITDIGVVEEVEAGTSLHHLRIDCSYPAKSIALGASIACAGICLTVTASGESWFEVDVGAETLARTTAGGWQKGTRLNLERALRVGDELGGHIVMGHVDGIAEILAVEDFEGMRRIELTAPHDLARFVAVKGSVALNGTSLTVNEVEDSRFSVLLIPHTLKATTWSGAQVGTEINVEVDLLARYAARLAETGSLFSQ